WPETRPYPRYPRPARFHRRESAGRVPPPAAVGWPRQTPAPWARPSDPEGGRPGRGTVRPERSDARHAAPGQGRATGHDAGPAGRGAGRTSGSAWADDGTAAMVLARALLG